MGRILFISHEATRSGAPLILLNLLRWVKSNTSIEFDIFMIEGGELESEFKKLGEIIIPDYSGGNFLLRIYRRFLIKLNAYKTKDPVENALGKLVQRNYSHIFGNTIISISIIEKAYSYFPQAKLILHIHELRSVTEQYYNEIEKISSLELTFIGVSKAVVDNLLNFHKLKSKIILIYPFIDLDFLRSTPDGDELSHSKYIIDGGGLVRITKGYDIFVLAAKRMSQKYPDIPAEFRWFGAIPTPELKYFLKKDIENGGLSDYLKFLGNINDPYAKYSESDLFLLTSREDSFPIICLEHAAFGIPCLCFEQASGISEFIENDAGVIISYLNIEELVDTIADLYQKPSKRISLGQIAKYKAQQYDINIQAPKIIDLILNA
jgi:glycosyltransferase involved in cell wall biosynthesis